MAKAEDGTSVKAEDVRSNSQLVTVPSSVSSRRRAKLQKSRLVWLLNNFFRIGVWYSIITILFRCPSDPQSLTSTDPDICKPALAVQHYLEPYVRPHYDIYAKPYVERSRPYIETANTRVIKPATVLANDNYNKYAAPQVAKAKDYTFARWEKSGLPQLRRAQEAAQQAYDDNLALHVQRASEVASPYYETAKDNAFNIHEKHIIPAIAFSQPHFQTVLASAQKFVLGKGVPFVQYAWTNVVIFVDGTLWPFVKRAYGDNVRPQLVMIGERIAKYQEGRKLQSAMHQVDFSSTDRSSTSARTTEEETPSIVATTSTPTTEASSSVSAAPSATPVVATDETVKHDLEKWQQKFAIAADKGTDDLKERIEDIVSSMTKSDLGEGQGLATALEKTVEVELASIKAKIKAVALTLPENESSDVAAAENEVTQAVRHSGSRIKGRAKNVRIWADTFKQGLKQRSELATDSTLHVLDDIRDLGLQEIGMRWAWMDGITYKHWQKYHDLKRTFADWRSEVRSVALSNQAISDAGNQADQVLEESMAVTEGAAKELIRLRDVAKWKIAARDSTDDFGTRAFPSVAAAASSASSLAGNIQESILGTRQGAVESLASRVSGSVFEGSSSASSSVASASTGERFNSVISRASGTAERLSAEASSAIFGSTGTIEALASDASSSGAFAASAANSAAEEFASSASSAIVGTSTGGAGSSASSLSRVADSAYTSATDSASSLAFSTTAGPSEGVLSSASSIADFISNSASSAVVSASASQSLQEAVNNAGDRVADFTSSLSAV